MFQFNVNASMFYGLQYHNAHKQFLCQLFASIRYDAYQACGKNNINATQHRCFISKTHGYSRFHVVNILSFLPAFVWLRSFLC